MPRFLLRDLATIGARTTDDAPVASGFVTAYVPGTTRLAVVYVDATTDQARAQPILLDETGKATLWVDAPVRLLIQAANGTTVFDGDPADTIVAAAVTLENPGWPASLDVNAALTALYASLGGLDGNHRPDPAAIDLAVSQWMREVCVSVKSFGATGDGLTDDRNAIVAAYTAVAQHTIKGGRGTLFFPAGVYRMGASFPIGDSGIRIVGSGIASTFLEFFAGDGSGMVINGPDGLDVAHLTVRTASVSAGIGIDVQNAKRLRFERVGVADASGVGFFTGMKLGAVATDTDATLVDCDIAAVTNAVIIDGSGDGNVKDIRIRSGSLTSDAGDLFGSQLLVVFVEKLAVETVRFGGPKHGVELQNTYAASVNDCNFADRAGIEDIKIGSGAANVKTWGNDYKASGGGILDAHSAIDPGVGNIYGDVSQNPVGQHGLVDASTTGDYVPNLDKGNYFKLNATGATVIKPPTSSYALRVGQGILFELTADNFTFDAIYTGLSSPVTRVQAAYWNGTVWMAGTPGVSQSIQTFTQNIPGTVSPTASNGGVVIIYAGTGGPGSITIDAPSGSPAIGDSMLFVLKGAVLLTGWVWNAAYNAQARYADDTPTGLEKIAVGLTGSAVIEFVFTAAGWVAEGAASKNHGPRISTSTFTANGAAGQLAPDLGESNVFRAIVTGATPNNVQIAAPTGIKNDGTKLRLILTVKNTSLGLGTWVASWLTLPDGETIADTYGWPFAFDKTGIIDMVWDETNAKWLKLASAKVYSTP